LKLTVRTCLDLNIQHTVTVMNMNFLFIKESWKKGSVSTKILCSTTVFNIAKQWFLSSKST